VAAGSLLQIIVHPSAASRDDGERGSSLSPGARNASSAATVSRAPARILTVDDLLFLSDLDRFKAVAESLPYMKAEDIAPLAERLAASLGGGIPDTGTDNNTVTCLLRALLLRWSEVDAPGMMAALETPAFRFYHGARVLAVCALAELRGVAALEAGAKWPRAAHAAAWEMLHRHPEQLEALLPWLGRKNGARDYGGSDKIRELLGPEKSLYLAAKLDNQAWAGETFESFEDDDFDNQLRMVKAMPPGKVRDGEMNTMLRRLHSLIKSDPDLEADRRALFRKEYEMMPPGGARDGLAGIYANMLAEADAGAAVAWAMKLPDNKARSGALLSVVASLPENTPTSVAMQLTVDAWRADPSAIYPLELQFGTWHANAPVAAEAWYRSITDPVLREHLMDMLVTMPGSDPSLFTTSEQRLAFAQNAEKIAKAGGNASVPEAWRRVTRLNALNTDGVSLAEWEIAANEERRFLSEAALRSRVERSPRQDALAFFDSIPVEERSLGAWYEAGKAKVVLDPAAASVWMESLPRGPERDAAATALVEYLAGNEKARGTDQGRSALLVDTGADTSSERDHEAAFVWAAGMSGEPERVRYTAVAALAWSSLDPAAARAAVSTANLPDAAKQALLNRMQGGSPP
jgi:hypothetical protein